VHPAGINEGSVELLRFEGAEGRDVSSRAVPPNLGILMLRFPVGDIDAFAAHAASEGIEIVMPPLTVELAPYGVRKLLAVRGPGGAWIEFFEDTPTRAAAK
jgi:catechol 2,3-dioxygenase-like lactoylglutathione lyase family enzyme